MLRLKLQNQGILETNYPKGPTMNRRPTWLQFSSHDNKKHRSSKHGVAILQYILARKLLTTTEVTIVHHRSPQYPELSMTAVLMFRKIQFVGPKGLC